MKQTINQYDFTEAFRIAGRGEQFSYDGLIALFDYLEQYEEETGEELELDVIALCCEWCEYESCIEAAKEYGEAFEGGQEEMEEEAHEWLLDQTPVICFDGGVIIANF